MERPAIDRSGRAEASLPLSGEQEVKGTPELNYVGDERFRYGSGIYFVSRSGDKTDTKFFDLKAEKVRRVFQMEKPPPPWIGGMPGTRQVRWKGKRLSL